MSRLFSGFAASLLLAGSALAQSPGLTEVPLTDKLAATLDGVWWCAGPNGGAGSTECQAIQRFHFSGRTPFKVEYCSVAGLEEIGTMSGALESMAPATWSESEAFFSDLAARARAHGADRIKFCESAKVSQASTDTICGAMFQRHPDTRVALSRTGRWRDPDDLVLADAEVDRLYGAVKGFLREMLAALPEKALAEAGMGDAVAILNGREVCDSYALRSDGAVLVRSAEAGSGDSPPTIMFPVAGPDAATLVIAPLF